MDKKQALAILFSSAEEYQNNHVDHSLLFLCTDKHKKTYCVEVTFEVASFLHLTGVVTTISPNNFFAMCLSRRLSVNDFEFAKDGTTEWKLEVLPRVVRQNLSANMIGEYNKSRPLLFTEKIAGSVSACMGFQLVGSAGRYIPNTLLKGDIRTLVDRADRIIATYRKKRSEGQYSDIVYVAKKVDWENITLPAEYAYLPLPK